MRTTVFLVAADAASPPPKGEIVFAGSYQLWSTVRRPYLTAR
ncbi:MAG TPA: hypothetical protein VFO58_02745 [Vicinamibacterales bacterium]|nr:hypothetical protein [Vicinamibacterales bacterium]